MTSALLLASALLAAAPAPAAHDPFADFKPLLGKWIGNSDEAKDAGTGWFTFEARLEGHVLVRTNHAEYPPRPDRPRVHDDMLVVFEENGALKGEYWDSEGHTIHYAVQAAPNRIVFLSEPAPGPRFRLTYTWDAQHANGVNILFEVAPPNAPDQFKPYIKAGAHR